MLIVEFITMYFYIYAHCWLLNALLLCLLSSSIPRPFTLSCWLLNALLLCLMFSSLPIIASLHFRPYESIIISMAMRRWRQKDRLVNIPSVEKQSICQAVEGLSALPSWGGAVQHQLLWRVIENQDKSKGIVVKGEEKCSRGGDLRERRRTMEVQQSGRCDWWPKKSRVMWDDAQQLQKKERTWTDRR